MNDDAIDRIRKRLDLLRTIDEGRHVFGASGHEYALEPTLDEAAIVENERRAGVSFPPDYRAYLGRIASSGAGPYYGLRPFPESDDLARWALADPFVGDAAADDDSVMKNLSRRGGALLLADQGCGYKSMLVLVGAKRGQVWADMREEHGGFVFEGSSFFDWYEQWLDKALVEWAVEALPALVGAADPSASVTAALELSRAPIERLADPNHELLPWETLYPISARNVLSALVTLHTVQGRFDEAEALVERLVAAPGDDGEALGILARTRILRAQHRDEDALRLADRALALPSLWHATRTAFLVEKEWALDLLDRHRERIATILERAKHTGDRFAYYDATWAQLEEGDVAGAVETLMLAGGKDGDIPSRAARALDVGEEIFGVLADSDLHEAGAKVRAGLEALARAT